MLFDIWRESTFGLVSLLNPRNCLVFVIGSLILLYFKRKDDRNTTPYCGGWIPWLGCAINFGKQPLEFIKRKEQQLGSVFTLYVAGENMTFLTDPEDFHYFFDMSNADFQQAVQEPVHKLASISKKLFYQHHTNLHDMVKGHLAPARIGQFVVTLSSQLNTQFQKHIDLTEPQDLMVIARTSMYASILNTLFGEGNPLVHREVDYEEFLTQFQRFDDDFELGVKLPSVFLPKWTSAKEYCLRRMQLTVQVMRGQTSYSDTPNIIDALWDTLDGDAVTHKYGMLVMFSSLANSVPASYWSLMYILTNENVREKVMAELTGVFGDRQGSCDITIGEEDLRKLTYLRWCVYETIRLRGEGVICRRVINNCTIKGYAVASGTMLMISPYWSHRDERYFPEPEVFIPERWEHSSIERKAFVAFGGGRYQCPGRWFGMMSMQTFVAMFLLKYSCTVNSPMPAPSLKHLVGVQHPESEFLISCRERESGVLLSDRMDNDN